MTFYLIIKQSVTSKKTDDVPLPLFQLGRAHEQIIQPLERFRKDHIGAVKVTISLI